MHSARYGVATISMFLKLGRAAARRSEPKLTRAIRVVLNEGQTKIRGGVVRE